MKIFDKLFAKQSNVKKNTEEENIVSTEYICEVIEPPVINSWRKISLLEEVVRCRDCKCYVDPEDYDLRPYCTNTFEGTAITPNTGRWVKPDGFCYWGKRREDG